MKLKINKMKLKKVYKILQNASAVVVSHDWDHVCHTDLYNLKDINENKFLILRVFNSSEDREFFAEFTEGDNQEVKVVGSSMFLIDSNKEEMQISILIPQNLEESLDENCEQK